MNPAGGGGPNGSSDFHQARLALAQQTLAAQQQPQAAFPLAAGTAYRAPAGTVRPMVAARPGPTVGQRAMLVSQAAAGPRVATARPQSTVAQMGRNIVIRQPAVRPGGPDSQITVPLATLQSLQPGQGIPTGQAGHLLVKTETGQYQILKVGQAGGAGAAAGAVSAAAGAAPVRPVGTVASTMGQAQVQSQAQVVRPQQVSAPVAVSSASTPNATIRAPAVAARAPAPATVAAAGGANAGGGTSPETPVNKCRNFLATLLKLARPQSATVANNVRTLIQGLIDGHVEAEEFTAKLQTELNSSPQPALAPFLKKALPPLREALRSGELSLEGIRPPPARVQPPLASPVVPQQSPAVRRRAPASVAQRPVAPPVQPGVQQQLRQLTPSPLRAPQPQPRAVAPPTQPQASPAILPSPRFATATVPNTSKLPANLQPTVPLPSGMLPQVPAVSAAPVMPAVSSAAAAAAVSGAVSVPTTPIPVLSASKPAGAPIVAGVAAPAAATAAAAVEKKAPANTFSAAGDEDINDVAAMGGVNLAEESQRMQQELIGTQVRSCKDEIFLQTGNLTSRVAKICAARGLEEPGPEVMALMSHATQDRLRTLLEKLSMVAEHRMDVIRLEGDSYEVTQDVKGQVRFLSEIDRLEKHRHEQAERQRLFMAAKSRTKTDDPEKEKLKERAKELQRLEEEQMLQEKANTTALMAIGGPKKKLRLDDSSAAAAAAALGAGAGKLMPSAMVQSRPKTKRVHQRDLLFLMEQEADLKRSPALWKAYIS